MLSRLSMLMSLSLARRLGLNVASDEPSAKRMLAGSGLLAGFRLADIALNAAALVLVARALGPPEFGRLGFSTAAAAFVYSLTDFGLTRAYVHRAASGRDLPACISTFFVLRIALLVVGALLTIALAEWAPNTLGLQARGGLLVETMLAVSSLRALASIGQLTLESQQRVMSSQTIVIAYSATYVVFVPAVAILTGDAQAVADASLAPAVLAFVASVWWLRGIGFGRPDGGIAREYAHYALPLIGGGTLASILAVLDQALLQAAWGPASVGFYAAAQRFVMPVNALWGAASNFMLASVVRARAGGRRLPEVAASVRRADATAAFLLVAIIAPLIVDSEGLIRPILGGEYRGAAPALSLLAVQVWADSTNFATGALLFGAGRSHGYGILSAATSVIQMLLVVVTVLPPDVLPFALGWGVTGAAFSVAVAACLGLAGTELLVARVYGIHPRVSPVLRLLAGVGLAWLIRQISGGFFPDLLRLAIEGVCVAAAIMAWPRVWQLTRFSS